MLGEFQQSALRIEIHDSMNDLRSSLTQISQLKKWLWPQQLEPGMPTQLILGLQFQTWLGPIPVNHQVDVLTENQLRLILTQGIDGFHEWHWGEGWVQSRMEGISLLPLNLGQTLTLYRLRQFFNH